MLKIVDISIIADCVVIAKGCTSGGSLNKSDLQLRLKDTQYSPILINYLQDPDVVNVSNNKDSLDFLVVFKLGTKSLNPNDLCIYIYAQKIAYEHINEFTFKEFLKKEYQKKNPNEFIESDTVLHIVNEVKDPTIEVSSYSNHNKKDFGFLKLEHDEGENTSLFITHKHTNGKNVRRVTISSPASKHTLKQVIQTNDIYTTTIIAHRSNNLSTLNFQYISSASAYTLIIKKLSRSNRGDKKFDSSRVIKNLGNLLGAKKRATLVDRYNKTQLSQSEGNYELFINRFEPKIESYLSKMYHKLTSNQKPLISIVTPLYNPPQEAFYKLYDSFVSQEHNKWEWILIDDCSTDRDTIKHVKKVIEGEPRIKLLKTTVNSHISKATNLGIENASGDLVGFCDHDDMLGSFALIAIVLSYNTHPEAKWFYSDEDFVTKDGTRHSPHLKSTFNPDLLKTHNYITHLSVVKKEIFEHIGLLDPSCNGAQDYDLHLRLASKLRPDQIIHIPLVLYHWRQLEGSTSKCANAKSYTHSAYELILVNNGSSEKSTHNLLKELNKRSNITIIEDTGNFNFSRLINKGAKHARGECLLLMNNDVEAIKAGWLEEIRDLAMDTYTGCVGCKLLYPDETIQHAGVILGLGGYAAHLYRGKERNYLGRAGRTYGRN